MIRFQFITFAQLLFVAYAAAQNPPSLADDIGFIRALMSTDRPFLERVATDWRRDAESTEKQVRDALPAIAPIGKQPKLQYQSLVRQFSPDETSFREYTVPSVSTMLFDAGTNLTKLELLDRMRTVTIADRAVVIKINSTLKKENGGILDPREVLSWAGERFPILADIDAKAQAFTIRRSTSLSATVRTVDPRVNDPEKNERSNFQVVYVEEFKFDQAIFWRTFDRLSSPTTQHLNAGFYVIWCRGVTEAGVLAEGEKKHVKLVSDQTLDVLIPLRL